jgi:stage V sporulation protein G
LKSATLTAEADFFYIQNQKQEEKIMAKTETPKAPAPEEAKSQALPTSVDVRINSIRPEGSTKAIASATLNGCFAVRNIKVMESSKGLFVSMPSYRAGNGQYRDICFPTTAEFRQKLNDAVIGAYHQALAQGQKEAAQQQPPFEAPEKNSGLQMGSM